jgi:hypothetical protein
MQSDKDLLCSLESQFEGLGQQYLCLPLQGDPDHVKIETPFRLPDGDKINLEVSRRNAELLLSNENGVINFLLLMGNGDAFLPLHLYEWVVTICAEQRVKEEKGRFVIHIEREEDLMDAITRMISWLLSIAALRYLLISPLDRSPLAGKPASLPPTLDWGPCHRTRERS